MGPQEPGGREKTAREAAFLRDLGGAAGGGLPLRRQDGAWECGGLGWAGARTEGPSGHPPVRAWGLLMKGPPPRASVRGPRQLGHPREESGICLRVRITFFCPPFWGVIS